MYISTTYPKAPLLGIGFSLGANVLTRYLVEEGEHSRLNAACVLASVSSLLFVTHVLLSHCWVAI